MNFFRHVTIDARKIQIAQVDAAVKVSAHMIRYAVSPRKSWVIHVTRIQNVSLDPTVMRESARSEH